MSFDEFGYTEGAGINVAAHKFKEDGKIKLVERVAPGAGTVLMPSSPQISESSLGSYPSSIIKCAGKSRFVIKTKFQQQSDSCVFRMRLYDSVSGEIGYTQELTASELGLSLESGEVDYPGTTFALSNEFGASGFKIRIVTAPSSTAKFTIGSI